jgi:hypothetical protein
VLGGLVLLAVVVAGVMYVVCPPQRASLYWAKASLPGEDEEGIIGLRRTITHKGMSLVQAAAEQQHHNHQQPPPQHHSRTSNTNLSAAGGAVMVNARPRASSSAAVPLPARATPPLRPTRPSQSLAAASGALSPLSADRKSPQLAPALSLASIPPLTSASNPTSPVAGGVTASSATPNSRGFAPGHHSTNSVDQDLFKHRPTDKFRQAW